MSEVTINENTLTGIANAIRGKLGVETTYKPNQMADAIGSIETPKLEQKSITENGEYVPSYGKNGISKAIVAVPNSYSAADEGKVVDQGALVAQTSKSINANGTHDTTTNDEVVVNVANSYSSSDEGKVVSSGALVDQSSQSITQNGTYDTTLKNEVVVNVSGGGGGGSANGFPVVEKYAEDIKRGYISNGRFYYDTNDPSRVDIWRIIANRKYVIVCGNSVGNRLRAMFTTVDLTQATSNVPGSIIDNDVDNPVAYSIKGTPLSGVSGNPRIAFSSLTDGYIAVGKTNQNVTGIPCYLIDVTDPPSSGSQKSLLSPIIFDSDKGFPDVRGWTTSSSGNVRTDVYEVKVGKAYFIHTGAVVGNRLRVGYSAINPIPTGQTSKYKAIYINDSSSIPNWTCVFAGNEENGYLMIQKTADGTNNLTCEVYEVTE